MKEKNEVLMVRCYLKFAPVEKNFSIMLLHEEAHELLRFQVGGTNIVSIDWNDCVDRSDYLISYVRLVVPSHFIIRSKSSTIHKLSYNDRKQQGKRGYSKKKHPFIVQLYGMCCAHGDGCETTYNAGLIEDDLREIVLGRTPPIKLKMIISGRCRHKLARVMGVVGVVWNRHI